MVKAFRKAGCPWARQGFSSTPEHWGAGSLNLLSPTLRCPRDQSQRRHLSTHHLVAKTSGAPPLEENRRPCWLAGRSSYVLRRVLEARIAQCRRKFIEKVLPPNRACL